MRKYRGTIIAFIMVFFAAGCAHTPVIDKSNSRKLAPEKQKSYLQASPSDADIISAALSYLNNREGEPDYNTAKAKLEIFIQEHPRSKWIENAQALILAINNLLDLREKVKTKSIALEKANAERAKLKKDYKYSEERYQTETARLQQENEQLKKDITLLKNLEIQMDKREKMLK